MALDRLIEQTGTGPNVSGSIQEELTGLWNRSVCRCESVGGTADDITCTVTPALTGGTIASGMQFLLVAAANNTGAVTLAINGGSPIPVVDAFGDPLAAGDIVENKLYTLVAEGGELRVAAGGGSGSSGGYNKRIYTADDTWSKPAGLVKVVVTVLAGGGGGGGAAADATISWAGGGGGGGGAIATLLAAALASTVAVTVGAGGAGGASGANDGSTGGSSSFGTHAVATGGAGGGQVPATTAADRFYPGGTGGVGTTGDILLRGGHAWPHVQATISGFLGDTTPPGAASAFGHAGADGVATSTNGAAATAGSGAGGSGGNQHTSVDRSGGNGGSGYVIVEEFF